MQAQGCLLSSEKLAGIPCEFCFQIANPFFFVFHVLFASVFAQVQRKGVKASLSARIHTGIPSEIRARLPCKFANQNSHQNSQPKSAPKIRTQNYHPKFALKNSHPKFAPKIHDLKIRDLKMRTDTLHPQNVHPKRCLEQQIRAAGRERHMRFLRKQLAIDAFLEHLLWSSMPWVDLLLQAFLNSVLLI